MKVCIIGASGKLGRYMVRRAVAGCDGVLTVLVPWGVQGYASGTAQAVLDHSAPDARLVFSCGWHITRDGKDVYSRKLRLIVAVFTRVARWLRLLDLDDQVEALTDDTLVQEAPAMVGRETESARAHRQPDRAS